MSAGATSARARRLAAIGAIGVGALAACQGNIGARGQAAGRGEPPAQTGTGGSGAPAPIASDIDINAASTDSVSAAPTRRLSNTEVANAFQVLTGAASSALATLPPDGLGQTFDRVVQSQTVIDRTVQAYAAMAEEAVGLLTDNQLATWSPACAASGALGTDGPDLAAARRPCADGLLSTWAETAYRRPLTKDERAALLALYDAAGTYRDGVSQMIRFVLQSPAFLYVIERGTPEPGRPSLMALDSYQVATRLSLLFCETLPDAQLLAAAAAGALQTPDEIAAQAARLFDLPCARRTVQRFYDQWLNLIGVPALMPDPAKFPDFNAKVRDGMIAEDHTFFEKMTWDAAAALPDLFRADFTYADHSLGGVYGLTGLSDTPQKVSLPDFRRGFLTHPSILALTSHSDRTSPVKRGVFVLRRLLCLPLANPPQNVNVNLPPIDPKLTARQQFQALTEQSFCQSCHGQINPIGFGMEDFDGIGEQRATDNGIPVDRSGSIPAIGVAGFDGAAALSLALADRPEVSLCFARSWLRFGLGRLESQDDATSLRALVDTERGGGSLRQVMIALVRTFAFRHRAAPVN